jgi:hypothetical protein
MTVDKELADYIHHTRFVRSLHMRRYLARMVLIKTVAAFQPGR